MKTILFFFLATVFVTTCYSQQNKKSPWFGEIHAGLQATLNDRPLVAQIKTGYETTSFDSSKHYTAYFRSQLPIELAAGFNNKKGFQFQVDVSYYSMKTALSNPPDVTINEEYLIGKAHMLSMKTSAFVDYNHINGEESDSRLHFLVGICTGVTIPLSMIMNKITAQHFGIMSFHKHLVWEAGIDLRLTVDVTKKLYIVNTVGFMLPLVGSFAQIQMQGNSAYFAGDPVKINSFKITSGVGLKF